MAEKHKTPEELGEAVGKKIEELFSGFDFGDDQPVQTAPATKTDQPAETKPPQPSRVIKPAPSQAPTRPQLQAVPRPVAQKKPPAQSAPSPAPPLRGVSRPPAQKTSTGSFDVVMERIEALILSVEWEMNSESIREIMAKLADIEPVLSKHGPARQIINMNLRVLPRFKEPDTVPHPALIKLLQNSFTALKQVYESQGRRQLQQSLVASISGSYKEIVASLSAETPTVPGIENASAAGPLTGLVGKMGSTVRAVEEVNQRLARILGVLRQGGVMSSDEITRRLGALESRLTESVQQLLSVHKQFADVGPQAAAQEKTGADGIMLVVWSGVHLAIPTFSVEALYMLTRAQAEQFADKPVITLANRQIQRLPLRRPAGAPRALPSLLVHISSKNKDYFILSEKLLGYRRAPKNVDIVNEPRLKIGQTSYILINQSVIR